jgi:hypothetical protein
VFRDLPDTVNENLRRFIDRKVFKGASCKDIHDKDTGEARLAATNH